MTKSYGNYSVTIADDGRIVVKKDDNLTSYSAAIHRGNTRQVAEFGRLRGSQMVPIGPPYQIREGETIFHMPTYMEKRNAQTRREWEGAFNQATEAAKKLEYRLGELGKQKDKLKSQQNVDNKEIQKLLREAKEIEEEAAALLDECQDQYTCAYTGIKHDSIQKDARKFKEKAEQLKRKSAGDAKSIEDLDRRIKDDQTILQGMRLLIQTAKTWVDIYSRN